MKEITISIEEYNRMVQQIRILEQLEANGVDNWVGYGCMCYEKGQYSCVFCEEK